MLHFHVILSTIDSKCKRAAPVGSHQLKVYTIIELYTWKFTKNLLKMDVQLLRS